MKQDFNKWLNDLSDDSIKQAVDDHKLLLKPSNDADKKITAFFNSKQKQEEERKIYSFNIFQPAFVFSGIMATAIVIFLAILFINNNLINPDKTAIASYISGNVQIITKNKIVGLTKNKAIKSLDAIKTAAGSDCFINIGDISSILIKPESEICFNSITLMENKIQINMLSGEIVAKVIKNQKPVDLTINTQFADIYVTGTEFSVKIVPDDFSVISVNEGKIKVAAKLLSGNQEIYLSSNESIMIKKDSLQKEEMLSLTKRAFENFDSLKIKYGLKESMNNIKEIYKFNYPEDQTKNKITGFVVSDNYVIAVTQVSIICFDTKGKMLWENLYGKDKGIFFMSLPYIYNNKIYVSSVNKKFLILSLLTGKEIKIIDSPGYIGFGYKITLHNNNLLLPFNSGIYRFNLINNNFDKNPFVPFNHPVTPLIYKDKIILSSYIERTLTCYNQSGDLIWENYLDDASYNSPAVIGNQLYIADNKAKLYKFNLEGKLIATSKLNSGITGNLIQWNNFIYALANNGYLYKFNINNLIGAKLFLVDQKLDITNYLFKSPVIVKNKLLIGTDIGELAKYNFNNGALDKIKFTDSAISTGLNNHQNQFFLGTYDGRIFMVKEY